MSKTDHSVELLAAWCQNQQCKRFLFKFKEGDKACVLIKCPRCRTFQAVHIPCSARK